jgi:cytochrome c2
MPAVVKVVAAVLVAVAAAGAAGCGGTSSSSLPGADASHGRALIEYYGCGACHDISGIQPKGRVGPSLVGFRDARQIAGVLPNTAANLVRWIQDPQQAAPKTDMPDLGIGKGARDIAAYLYEH